LLTPGPRVAWDWVKFWVQGERAEILLLVTKAGGCRMKKFTMGLTLAAGMVASLWGAPQALAGACLGSPTCTLDGQTFTVTGGTSGNGLTFVAFFTTPNQSNSSIATLVDDYLALLGVTATYLGRQDGSGTIDGDSVSTASSNGGLTGTWTFSPGTTGDVGAYVAIHAGNGQMDTLFQINSPGTSGTWGTENGKDLSNFDLFGTRAVPAPVIGSGLAEVLGVGGVLFGFGLLERRRKHRSLGTATPEKAAPAM
jgi:hypothetical protein